LRPLRESLRSLRFYFLPQGSQRLRKVRYLANPENLNKIVVQTKKNCIFAFPTKKTGKLEIER